VGREKKPRLAERGLEGLARIRDAAKGLFNQSAMRRHHSYAPPRSRHVRSTSIPNSSASFFILAINFASVRRLHPSSRAAPQITAITDRIRISAGLVLNRSESLDSSTSVGAAIHATRPGGERLGQRRYTAKPPAQLASLEMPPPLGALGLARIDRASNTLPASPRAP
jgi:hypothetical protein